MLTGAPPEVKRAERKRKAARLRAWHTAVRVRPLQGVSMARVTVEDCLEHEENRFALVLLASKRTRNLMKGAPALVHSKNRPAVTALREIASQRVHFSRAARDAVEEYIAEEKELDSSL